MPGYSENNSREEKRLARKKYAERQFDKWIKWSFEIKGRIKYKDILKKQEELNLTNNNY
jgi:hypothetical protein